jgi:hypothetical protein
MVTSGGKKSVSAASGWGEETRCLSNRLITKGKEVDRMGGGVYRIRDDMGLGEGL